MRRIDFSELPNLDDPMTKEIGLRIQKMRSAILKAGTTSGTSLIRLNKSDARS